jgi:hypothetical protein
MWPSIKRWRDWVANDFWPRFRLGPQSQALHYSFEQAGLTLSSEPIPWTADAVLVAASLRLPPAARRKSDFALRLGTGSTYAADCFRRAESDDRYQLQFRFSPPPATTVAALLWRGHALGQLTLPVLDAETFLVGLQMQLPTVAVSLGDRHLACSTFVASQCRGLLASAVLNSPTILAPIAKLGISVEFHGMPGGESWTVPVTLSGSQLAARQALIVAPTPKLRYRPGIWKVRWRIGGEVVTSQRVRAISAGTFRASLTVCESRFAVSADKGQVSLRRQAPGPGEAARVGPGFFVASREPGMAAMARLQVHALGIGSAPPRALPEQSVLITDGPTLVPPSLLDAKELSQFAVFELRCREIVLGALSLRPSPTANFTPEGGFTAPPEFAWTPTAEDELTDRLGKLIDGSRE